MAGGVVPRGFDLAQAILTLGMMALVIGTGTVTAVRRWRGLNAPSRAQWSPQQIATERHWRVALAILLTVSWATMTIVLIEGALKPGIAASLPQAIGPLPLPAWLALALIYHGLWYLLWATGTWFSVSLDSRDGVARPFKPVYGLICFLIAASFVANVARIWS
jgi:hypothetical protein